MFKLKCSTQSIYFRVRSCYNVIFPIKGLVQNANRSDDYYKNDDDSYDTSRYCGVLGLAISEVKLCLVFAK